MYFFFRAFLSLFFSLKARQAPPARLARGTTAARERRPLGMSRRALLAVAAPLPVQGDEGLPTVRFSHKLLKGLGSNCLFSHLLPFQFGFALVIF